MSRPVSIREPNRGREADQCRALPGVPLAFKRIARVSANKRYTIITGDLEIRVELGHRAAIVDTGRGMKITPDPGDSISHAEKALTSTSPILPTDPQVEAVLKELVWGERGSLGPAIANAACAELRISSRRDGQEWTQAYTSGVPTGPPRRVGSAGAPGTTVWLTTTEPIDHETIQALASQLRTKIVGLRLTVVPRP